MTTGEALLTEIAAGYGTPVYVYDLAEVRAAHRELAAALPPGSRLCYAVKANPFPAVIRELVAAGCAAEVSSPHELSLALRARCAADQILYTGPAKKPAELDEALRRGVRLFTAESRTDLRRIGDRAVACGAHARVLLRLNPQQAAPLAAIPMGGLPSQFGVDIEAVCADPDRYRAPATRIVGFQVFSGSNAPDSDALRRGFQVAITAAARAAAALDVSAELLDLGGGFGHPYARPGSRPNLRGLGASVSRQLERAFPGTGRVPQLLFESGRYLVGAAGSLLLRIQEIKQSKAERFVIADGGVNVLGGMSGLRRVAPATAVPVPRNVADGRHSGVRTRLVGPLCTPLDMLNPDLADADELREGDLLRVPNTGAYGLTASLLAFLGRECPAEVAVDGGSVLEAARISYSYTDVEPCFAVERRRIHV